MNEPKKRGRPNNAEKAAREAATAPSGDVTHNGDTSRQPEDVIEEQEMTQVSQVAALLKPDEDRQKAQAYAIRVWNGQSVSLGRADRVRRIRAALEGQGLSMEGVKLPGDSDDDGEEWTAEDAKPVTWRKASV
jgi:hypothetical protein